MDRYPPFLRTLLPIGAVSLLPPNKKKFSFEDKGKGTVDHLMPSGDCFLLKLKKFPSKFDK